MAYLFTYGTLQDVQVQHYIFGRELEGKPDVLPGFQKQENAVYGRYPLVVETNDAKDGVAGVAYLVTDEDLSKADIYETSAYQRKLHTLVSGLEAWLYVKNSD